MAAQVEEMNMNLITEQHIILDMEGSTQKEILHALAEIAFREGNRYLLSGAVQAGTGMHNRLWKRNRHPACPSYLYKGSRNSVRQNET